VKEVRITGILIDKKQQMLPVIAGVWPAGSPVLMLVNLSTGGVQDIKLKETADILAIRTPSIGVRNTEVHPVVREL
jgi:hypothetical protein